MRGVSMVIEAAEQTKFVCVGHDYFCGPFRCGFLNYFSKISLFYEAIQWSKLLKFKI